jgi:microcompartment protein CcmK/EutM
MKKMEKVAFMVLVFSTAFISGVNAAIINAASCSQSDVQIAITGAADGDTVLIPAGSCSWTTGVSWSNQNIKVIGAGIGNTVINWTGSSGRPFSIGMTTGTSGTSSAGTTVKKVTWRLSSLTINGATSGDEVISISSLNSNNSTPIMGWRVDHLSIDISSVAAHGVFVYGITWGLIDHFTFTGGTGSIGVILYSYLNRETTNTAGATSWGMALNLGSDEAVYVEDSTFPFINAIVTNSAMNDMGYGAAIVVRHCTITATEFLAHTGQGGHRGGMRKFEVYNNTFNGTGTDGQFGYAPMVLQGGDGTGVVFNNTVSGYGMNKWLLQEYRTSVNYYGAYYGNCQGAANPDFSGPQSYDGNIEASGWPCLDQIGRSSGVPLGTAQASVPVYFWNNGADAGCAMGGTCDGSIAVGRGGTPLIFTSTTNSSTSPYSLSSYISTSAHSNGDKDYCTATTTMPTSCGNHTNTYVPYTYPHPLNIPPPAPPKSLRIVN